MKAALPHSRNKFHSVSLAYAVHMKETYENLQVLLQKYMLGRTPVEYMC